MMIFDAMIRADAAGRIALAEAAAVAMGAPATELVVRDSVISHAKPKKSMSFAVQAMIAFIDGIVRHNDDSEAFFII
jgi:hypothetical protein